MTDVWFRHFRRCLKNHLAFDDNRSESSGLTLIASYILNGPKMAQKVFFPLLSAIFSFNLRTDHSLNSVRFFSVFHSSPLFLSIFRSAHRLLFISFHFQRHQNQTMMKKKTVRAARGRTFSQVNNLIW